MEKLNCQPFPDSWYFVGLMKDYIQGRLYPIQVCGRPLLLVKVSNTEVRVFDDICPHLDVKLSDSFNGRNSPMSLEDNEIVCLYHRYRYNLDGDFTGGVYGKPNPTGPIPQRPVDIKHNQLILVFLHYDNLAPDWQVPDIDTDINPDGFFITSTRVAKVSNALKQYRRDVETVKTSDLASFSDAKVLLIGQSTESTSPLGWYPEKQDVIRFAESICLLSSSFYLEKHPRLGVRMLLTITPEDERMSRITTILYCHSIHIENLLLPKRLSNWIGRFILHRRIKIKDVEALTKNPGENQIYSGKN